MITNILLFNTEHEAAVALNKLKNSGTPASSLSVLVSNVEHSRLLNAETDVHVDLLSEIASANRRDEGDFDQMNGASREDRGYGDGGRDGVDEVADFFSLNGAPSGIVVPFYAQQPTMQVPSVGIFAMGEAFGEHEQGVPSLMAYGLSEDNARHCLQALRNGQCIVCVREQGGGMDGASEPSLFHSLSLGFSEESSTLPDIGAVEVLENRL